MTHFAAQLNAQLQKAQLTKYRLAKLAGVQDASVINIANGKKRPTDDILERFSQVEVFGVSLQTLQSWRLPDDYPADTIIQTALAQLEAEDSLLTFFNALQASDPTQDTETLAAFLLKALENSPQLGQVLQQLPKPFSEVSHLPLSLLEPKHLKKIPCLGTVAAGRLSPAPQPEDIAYYDWIESPDVEGQPLDQSTERSPNDNRLFCLRVQGQSMSPLIPEGSLVLVRSVDTLKTGGIYVIETDDHETTCKLVELASDGLTLKPMNPAYDAFQLSGFQFAKAYEVLEYKVTLKH